MNFINKYFIEYENTLMGRLEYVGFLRDERRIFLRETSSGLLHAIRNMNLETVIKILLSDNPSELLNSINIIPVAAKLDMDAEKVTIGIEAIAPVIKQVFVNNNKEIVVAVASLAWETTDEYNHIVKNRSA